MGIENVGKPSDFAPEGQKIIEQFKTGILNGHAFTKLQSREQMEINIGNLSNKIFRETPGVDSPTNKSTKVLEKAGSERVASDESPPPEKQDLESYKKDLRSINTGLKHIEAEKELTKMAKEGNKEAKSILKEYYTEAANGYKRAAYEAPSGVKSMHYTALAGGYESKLKELDVD